MELEVNQIEWFTKISTMIMKSSLRKKCNVLGPGFFYSRLTIFRLLEVNLTLTEIEWFTKLFCNDYEIIIFLVIV